ncbi:MAG: hypothetical protein HQK99_17760 [Nitrospirae bacterium]|nr:hypothetical protein [Nitrospirota bacterium]
MESYSVILRHSIDVPKPPSISIMPSNVVDSDWAQQYDFNEKEYTSLLKEAIETIHFNDITNIN